jgi:hypothetical protein
MLYTPSGHSGHEFEQAFHQVALLGFLYKEPNSHQDLEILIRMNQPEQLQEVDSTMPKEVLLSKLNELLGSTI